MRYHVDPDQLHKLAGGLLDVQAGLSRLGTAQPAPGATVGASEVAEALQDVSRNWSRARRRLLSDLRHLTGATQTAAANYVVVDEGAAAGCGPVQAHP